MAVSIDLYHLAEVVVGRFVSCKVTLLFPLSILDSLEGNHYAQPNKER